MNLRLASSARLTARAELVFGLAFDQARPKLARELDAAIRAFQATGDLATAPRKVSLYYPSRGPAKRLAFVGMGKRDEVETERLRRAAAQAQERAEDLGVREFWLWVEAADHGKVAAADAGRAIAEGLVLGAYRYEPPRKERRKARHGQRAVVVYGGAERRAFAAGFELGTGCAEATALARELGNLPANECTPSYLAKEARKLAGRGVSVRVLERAHMARLKMGALLGVARGSVEPPKLIVLDHRPAGAKRTVCIAGKGLTFDSGGISIKPSAKMDEMRYDMCGAAAVLGLFAAIRRGALRGTGDRTRVVGLIGSCENMPDASAQKPGDVVRACNGTTIEVLNTDAEGRLVLADVLGYAVKTFKPSRIVDLATLTGAVIVALGHEATGVMGTDDKLIGELIDAGKVADEPLWQLPLWEMHKEQLKSKFADLANINGQNHGGGSIAGGAFLAHFVGDTPWAHLDIAGTAWGGKSRDYYRAGAAGVGVRTLVHWLRARG